MTRKWRVGLCVAAVLAAVAAIGSAVGGSKPNAAFDATS